MIICDPACQGSCFTHNIVFSLIEVHPALNAGLPAGVRVFKSSRYTLTCSSGFEL